MAHKLGPNIKLPTAKELCVQLGVTITTLDRSLAKLEDRGVIRRLQGSGIYVADALQKKTIGVVFGLNIFDAGIPPIYSILLSDCEKRAMTLPERYSTYIGSPGLSGSHDAAIHHDLEEALKNHRLDGLLLFAKASKRQEEVLREFGVPMAVMTAHGLGPGVVTLDTESLIRDAAETLRQEGCRTLGFLGPLPEHCEMFSRAIASLGLSTQEKWILNPDVTDKTFTVHEGLFGRQNFGHNSATQILSWGRAEMPDGLISTDDMITRAACSTFTQRGLQIGKNFKFATQSNKDSMILAEWSRDLIQFEFDPQESIDAMFDVLDRLMRGLDASEPRLVRARRH